MSKAFEHTVVEYLEMFDVDHPDFTKMMTYLAPDARYLNIVAHSEPVHGRAAVEASLRDQYTRYKDCACNIISIASNGSLPRTARKSSPNGPTPSPCARTAARSSCSSARCSI
jgi:hypothetical protein